MDEFSDDGLDDLNDTALQELEEKAIQLTQAQKHASTQHHVLEYEFDDDDDLDDTVVIDEHAQPPPQPPSIQQPRHATQRWNQPGHPPPARPSYPARPQYPPSRPIQRPGPSQQAHRPGPNPSQRYHSLPAGRPQHPAPPPRQSQFAPPPPPGPRPHLAPPPSQAVVHNAGLAQHQNEIIAALQARLAEMGRNLEAAKGEAAIMRNKYDKSRATHEADIARLKKENAEQLAKHDRIVEQARAAERTTATELQFARQDLREELGRAKSRRKDGPGTPKKDRTWGMADGFDGVELLSSPTKTQTLRRKDSAPAALSPVERTPSKGKRKRPIVDSPTFALEIDGGDAPFEDMRTAGKASSKLTRAAPAPSPFDYLRLFLDHAVRRDEPPTFDAFSHYALPDNQKQSLASIILQRLPQMGRPGEPLSVLVDLADLLIDMWQQCLLQRYYDPIYYLVALLAYTLSLNAVAVAPNIIPTLVPVCATTCRLVALPRLNTVDGELSAHPDSVIRQLCLNIDIPQCLALLYVAALGCQPQPVQGSDPPELPMVSAQEEFWRTMELDFVLTMLSAKHPEADWLAMMSLLRTSVTSNSIGPIPSPSTDSSAGRAEGVRSPGATAATVIDSVTLFLYELPRWAAPGSDKEIVAKWAALETLVVFATSPFGARQMAESDVAILRLVTMLCWALDRLYDSELPLTSAAVKSKKVGGSQNATGVKMDLDDSDATIGRNAEAEGADDEPLIADDEPGRGPDAVTLLCRIISQTTWLLHFLVTDKRTCDVANTSTKLAASHGGSQRYFLTLARLNFAEEDLVIEAGIDAETVELAHELLELAVTPDEGEEISEMFD